MEHTVVASLGKDYDIHYDLTHTISAHLDRHLVFPLLEFLKSKKVQHHLCAG